MTKDNDADDSSDSGINRRSVLKSAAVASAGGFVGLPVFSGSATAQSSEALYLTDSGGDNGFSSTGTKLFEVDLVTENGTAKAKLSLLDERTSGDFNQVDAIAATPDGDVVYYVDKNSERLGKYDVENDSFSDEGSISDLPGDEVVLATYSPSGTFYVAGQKGDELFTIDPSGPTASKVTEITGVDVQGADIAFDASGTLYLFSSDDGKLYTVDPDDGTATEVDENQSDKGSYTGLAIRDAGAGALVGSSTSNDTIYEIDKSTGSEDTGYRMYEGGSTYEYGFGDMTVGQLASSTTFQLCADQDTNVGTVTVTDSPDEITITFETTGGWELYETHVDIGDEFDDFPTAGNDNPKVGQFDLSGSHDGETTVSYSVGCGDDALSDVEDYSQLLIAAHAVVKPTDGCADFASFEVGDSAEGLGTVNPVLDIESISSVSGAEAVAQKEGEKPATYGAPSASGSGGSEPNGCLNSYGDGREGFSDIATKNADGSHAYRFTFAESVSVNDFSVRMLDFGDYNPKNKSNHRVEMIAYDEGGNEVDTQVLEYTSGDGTNPNEWEPVEGTSKTNTDLQLAGDACDAEEGEPGNYVWSVSGDAITRVELEVVEGTDPNIAFTDLCFTANDETAWVCEQDGVETFTNRGNWARYLEYGIELFEGCGE